MPTIPQSKIIKQKVDIIYPKINLKGKVNPLSFPSKLLCVRY